MIGQPQKLLQSRSYNIDNTQISSQEMSYHNADLKVAKQKQKKIKKTKNKKSKKQKQKGNWTQEEDDLLIQLVEEYGPKNWSQIALKFPKRIGKQCRERWHNHLNPEIKKDKWTEEEDQILIQTHAQYGNKWAIISQFIPGRTDNCIKNHWNSTIKRKIKLGEIEFESQKLSKQIQKNTNKKKKPSLHQNFSRTSQKQIGQNTKVNSCYKSTIDTKNHSHSHLRKSDCANSVKNCLNKNSYNLTNDSYNLVADNQQQNLSQLSCRQNLTQIFDSIFKKEQQKITQSNSWSHQFYIPVVNQKKINDFKSAYYYQSIRQKLYGLDEEANAQKDLESTFQNSQKP